MHSEFLKFEWIFRLDHVDLEFHTHTSGDYVIKKIQKEKHLKTKDMKANLKIPDTTNIKRQANWLLKNKYQTVFKNNVLIVVSCYKDIFQKSSSRKVSIATYTCSKIHRCKRSDQMYFQTRTCITDKPVRANYFNMLHIIS